MPHPVPVVNGRKLDRERRVDLRSLAFPAVDPPRPDEELAKELRSYTLSNPVTILDQGAEGSCTGHGAAHALMCIAVLFGWITHDIARLFYFGARRRDEWAGENYEGSSVTGVMKYLVDAGLILSFRWCFTVIQIAYMIGVHHRAVVAGCDWYFGMFETDDDGFVHASGSIEGGHCVAFGGVHVEWIHTDQPHTLANLDWVRSYFKIPNSWSEEWGEDGFCKLAFIDCAKLIQGGDFAVMYGERRTATEEQVRNTP